jgi:tripartite-type tricarboxylate transporter receptor subunit TctC
MFNLTRLLVSVFIIAAPSWARAASADQDFYRGKTIRIIVGFAAGGGFDAYARVIARNMGRHIPGNPSIIVDNMPAQAAG